MLLHIYCEHNQATPYSLIFILKTASNDSLHIQEYANPVIATSTWCNQGYL